MINLTDEVIKGKYAKKAISCPVFNKFRPLLINVSMFKQLPINDKTVEKIYIIPETKSGIRALGTTIRYVDVTWKGGETSRLKLSEPALANIMSNVSNIE